MPVSYSHASDHCHCSGYEVMTLGFYSASYVTCNYFYALQVTVIRWTKTSTFGLININWEGMMCSGFGSKSFLYSCLRLLCVLDQVRAILTDKLILWVLAGITAVAALLRECKSNSGKAHWHCGCGLGFKRGIAPVFRCHIMFSLWLRHCVPICTSLSFTAYTEFELSLWCRPFQRPWTDHDCGAMWG